MKFEYKFIDGKTTEEHLNDLGAEGWEMVTVVVRNNQPIIYFKREKK